VTQARSINDHSTPPGQIAGSSDAKTLRLEKVKITVLAGGPGSERDVSLESGRAVAEALASLGHEVQTLDILPENLAALDVPADVVFPALHGEFGEDGTLQAILESRGIRYVGSGPQASALAMDKAATKRLCSRASVPTAEWQLITNENRQAAARNWSGSRVVLKPIDRGSSVDCYIVPDDLGLEEALDRLLGRYGRCLVERYVDGPELTVGILGRQALPVIQIVPRRRFYDYEAKYADDATRYLVNPPLDAALLRQVQALSLGVFEILGCRDMARVDWRVDAASQTPYLLEVNTIPGFTSHSLLPKAAAAAGIDFPRLCRILIEMAMSRSRSTAPGTAGTVAHDPSPGP